MPGPFGRTPFTQKPQFRTRVHVGNSLCQGLRFAAYPCNGTWYDAVSGVEASLTAAVAFGTSSLPTKNGWSNRGDQIAGVTSGHFKFPIGLPVDHIVGAFSVFIESSPVINASARATTGKVFATGEGVTGSGFSFGFDDVTTVNNGFAIVSNTGGAGTTISSTSNILGSNSETFIHRIAACYDGTNCRLHANGVFDKTASMTAPVTAANRRTHVHSTSNTADNSGSQVCASVILAWNRALTDEEVREITLNPWQVFAPIARKIYFQNPASCALTGTVTTATETDIVTGGKTIILTLTNDTWVASGATFDAQRQNIIDGIDSAQAEATGWDATVKATQGVAGVVRTSNTVVTITLDAQATYNITATETITATIPASALTGGSAIIATPTFDVTPVGVTGNPWNYYAQLRRMAA